MDKRRLATAALGTTAALAVVIQLVPYGRAHDNPPVTAEPRWDSPQTAELVRRACYDCHSNEVSYPWYSQVAPVSWLVQHDVEEGRAALNFSEWDKPQEEASEAAEVVLEGEMPMPIYTIAHPEARLSAAEQDALVRGLERTLGTETARRESH